MSEAGGPIIWDTSTVGHKLEYMEFVRRHFGGRIQVGLGSSEVRSALAARRLVIGTLEGASIFPIVALLRGLIGRPTVLFTFRAHLTPTSTVSRFLKRAAFGVLGALPTVKILNIVPGPPEGGGRGAYDWLHDLQLFDIEPEAPGREATTALAQRIREAAAGRRIILSPALQKAGKGADVFLRMYAENPLLRERCLFVVCGRMEPALDALGQGFVAAGGFLESRFIEQDEFLDLYRVADAVWCCYPPSQDMSSGVFGRAFQFGRATIVREDSILADAQRLYGSGVAIRLAGDARDAEDISNMDIARSDNRADVRSIAARAMEKLSGVMQTG